MNIRSMVPFRPLGLTARAGMGSRALGGPARLSLSDRAIWPTGMSARSLRTLPHGRRMGGNLPNALGRGAGLSRRGPGATASCRRRRACGLGRRSSPAACSAALDGAQPGGGPKHRALRHLAASGAGRHHTGDAWVRLPDLEYLGDGERVFDLWRDDLVGRRLHLHLSILWLPGMFRLPPGLGLV